MLLDRSHRPWAILTALLAGVSFLLYAVYASRAPDGPRGGSAPGLAFGIAASVCIGFAALLGARKRRPHYRLGRVATWLKGHLWLGALSLPLVLFHAGFRFGGTLTSVLMGAFLAVYVTGVMGLVLQQFLPRVMTQSLPQETVFEQLDHVREELLAEAEHMVKGEGGAVARPKSAGRVQGRVVESRAAAAEAGPDRNALSLFLERQLRPYFAKDGARRSRLADASARAALFEELRRTVDPALHPVTRDLEALAAQRDQIEMQRRLHLWLHGWLLVHVPLSYAMCFLGAVHALMALYYG
ncbi:MAG TPA: hypothetical protein VFY93_11665 [Planctomycetota bacterium]|nr:hypothetical protein [Planctomycetota bacterium]